MEPSKPPQRRSGLAVVAGITIALLILVGGLGWVLTRSHNWSAKATAVVLPAPGIPSGTAASYYDTLSRGQIVETDAEILRLKKFQDTSASGLNLTPAQAQKTTVTVSVVPNTALITITATATSGTVAEAIADGVFNQASQYIRSLSSPYVLNSVSGAKGTATESTSHTGGFLAVLLVVALVVGLAMQQAISQLVNARGRTVSSPAQLPASQVVPAPTQEPFATPTPTAPQQPAPIAVRPTVTERRPRPRWPAEPGDNGAPEPAGNGTSEPAGNGTSETAGKRAPEPAGKSASAPAGKGASEPAGKSASGSGRVEERTPES